MSCMRHILSNVNNSEIRTKGNITYEEILAQMLRIERYKAVTTFYSLIRMNVAWTIVDVTSIRKVDASGGGGAQGIPRDSITRLV
jgi:hypothetical protein